VVPCCGRLGTGGNSIRLVYTSAAGVMSQTLLLSLFLCRLTTTHFHQSSRCVLPRSGDHPARYREYLFRCWRFYFSPGFCNAVALVRCLQVMQFFYKTYVLFFYRCYNITRTSVLYYRERRFAGRGDAGIWWAGTERRASCGGRSVVGMPIHDHRDA